MSDFWIAIISSFLGAVVALGGAFWMYKIQENQKFINIKTSIYIELEDIENVLKQTHEILKSQNLNGTNQVMHNRIYYEPSNFDTYKADLSRLNKVDFSKVFHLYRRIKEFEEVRSFLIKRKEEGIDLERLAIKEHLTPDERTTKMFMNIYEGYFLNLDLLIDEINELKQMMK